MATLRIWDTVMALQGQGLPLIRADSLMAYQEVDFTAGEARSDPFENSGAAGRVVSLISDVDCAVRFNGADATTDDFPVSANERTDFYSEGAGTVSVIAV